MSNCLMTKPVYRWLFLCVFILLLLGCGSENSQTQSTKQLRLITLSPHLAELVDSAGAMKNLVGVVAHSDFPGAAKSIQIVGDAFKLDYEAIVSLKPDYILSWKNGTPQAIITKLKQLNMNVIETEITTLADIPKVIAQIATLTHSQSSAQVSINKFNNTLKNIQKPNNTTKSIFIETYGQPLYTVSGKHWISEAVSLCAFENIFENLTALSAPVSLEAIIDKNPQAILNIAKQKDSQWLRWETLTAVQNQQIYTIDPDYLSRPTMRLLIGIEKLCSYSGRSLP